MVIPAGLTLTVSPPAEAEAKAPEAVATPKEAAELECGICWDPLSASPTVALRCTHVFHKTCIDQLVAHQGTAKDIKCPICRTGRR